MINKETRMVRKVVPGYTMKLSYNKEEQPLEKTDKLLLVILSFEAIVVISFILLLLDEVLK